MATKRELIVRYGERLAVDYNGEYTACAEKDDPYEVPAYDPVTGDLTGTEVRGMGFSITYHKGMMPAFDSTEYATIDALLDAMREIAPLSHWRIVHMD